MKKLILLAALLLSPLSMLSQNATIEHPWKGARVAFIGDSITDPGAVPDNHDWTGRMTSIIGAISRSGWGSDLSCMVSADGNGMMSSIRRNS